MVIILTANATPEARQECERAGINGYLTKPVDALTLLDAVARLTLTPARNDAPELSHPAHQEQNASGFINEDTLHHLALLGGDQEDFLRTVVYGFLSETDKLVEAMRIALFKQDYATFKELAHILKGSAGNVGAEILFNICRQILQLGEAELKVSATALLKEALDSYPPTRSALQRYLSDANLAAM